MKTEKTLSILHRLIKNVAQGEGTTIKTFAYNQGIYKDIEIIAAAETEEYRKAIYKLQNPDG